MDILKIKWQRALSIFALVLAAFFVVNGMENKDEKHLEVKSTLVSDFLVNKGTAFSPRSTVNVSSNCIQTDSKSCVYQLTEEGMENVPDQQSYTPSQIEEFESNGWITPHPQSSSALYLN